MTTETKRDLHADLAICSAATSGGWYLNVANDEHCGAFYADDGSIVMDFGAAPNAYDQVCGDAPSPEDAEFIAEARTGWPHAIERAINAEAERDRLRVIVSEECPIAAFDIATSLRTEMAYVRAENKRLRTALETVAGASMSMFATMGDMAGFMKRAAREAIKDE